MYRKACHLRPRNRLVRESTGGCIARELPVFHNKLAVASQLRHSEQGNNVGMNNNDDRKFEHISDPYRRPGPGADAWPAAATCGLFSGTQPGF